MLDKGGFGEFFNKKRRELGLTLREFCKQNSIDPGNLSKIERGLMTPPKKKEIRLKYAEALGIKENSDEWLEFYDLAELSAHRIPSDIASDEEVMNALPILFRSARGRQVSEEDLKKLIGTIRKELR